MEPACSALRDATDQIHRALEERPLTQRVLSGAVTLQDYTRWLQTQRAVLQPWCEAYPRCLRRACRVDPGARLEALHLDLAALHDCVLDEPALGDFSFDWDDGAPQWWGALYAFEAARGGARHMAHHLRQQLGVCVAGALRYLDPAPEGPAQPGWNAIALCIERCVEEPDLPQAIEGARVAYGYLHAACAEAEANAPELQAEADPDRQHAIA